MTKRWYIIYNIVAVAIVIIFIAIVVALSGEELH